MTKPTPESDGVSSETQTAGLKPTPVSIAAISLARRLTSCSARAFLIRRQPTGVLCLITSVGLSPALSCRLPRFPTDPTKLVSAADLLMKWWPVLRLRRARVGHVPPRKD